MNEYPPRRSFIPGRWQPLHDGHVALIRTLLAEGRLVVIGIMDTPISTRNPHTLATRKAMFRKAFKRELDQGLLRLLPMPWVDEVVYGRDVGWRCREVRLDEETEAISGTGLRSADPVADAIWREAMRQERERA